MKRKVIQLAGKTLVVSLPSRWAREYGIKKGDEVEVEESLNGLFIRLEKGFTFNKIKLDISNLNERMIRWALSALQKRGFDEFEIRYKGEFQIKIINELIKNLFMGFAIIKQTGTVCTIRSLSQDVGKEFDVTLRRAFQVTISMGESMFNMIEEGNLEQLKSLVPLENTNNQLTNFCERIINKQQFTDKRNNQFMYVICWNLEKICDDYKYICEFLSEKENWNMKIDENLLKHIQQVNNYVKKFYQIFYKFSMTELNDLSERKKKIISDMRDSFSGSNKKEIIVLNYLINIIYKVADFSASTIALNDTKLNLR